LGLVGGVLRIGGGLNFGWVGGRDGWGGAGWGGPGLSFFNFGYHYWCGIAFTCESMVGLAPVIIYGLLDIDINVVHVAELRFLHLSPGSQAVSVERQKDFSFWSHLVG